MLIRLFLDRVLDIIHFLRATRKKAPHQMCGGTYPRLFEGISVIATQRLEFGFDGVEFVVWIGATFTPSDAILRRFVWMHKHRLVSCRVDALIFPFVGRERSRRLSVSFTPSGASLLEWLLSNVITPWERFYSFSKPFLVHRRTLVCTASIVLLSLEVTPCCDADRKPWALCRCHAKVLLFVSPRVIGFRANNRSSNLVFLTFCEDRSTQSLATMQRHNEIQDGGPNEVEMATIWPFLRMKRP